VKAALKLKATDPYYIFKDSSDDKLPTHALWWPPEDREDGSALWKTLIACVKKVKDESAAGQALLASLLGGKAGAGTGSSTSPSLGPTPSAMPSLQPPISGGGNGGVGLVPSVAKLFSQSNSSIKNREGGAGGGAPMGPLQGALTSEASLGSGILPMGKEALKTVLLDLIDDERFLDVLHGRYLKTLNSKSKL